MEIPAPKITAMLILVNASSILLPQTNAILAKLQLTATTGPNNKILLASAKKLIAKTTFAKQDLQKTSPHVYHLIVSTVLLLLVKLQTAFMAIITSQLAFTLKLLVTIMTSALPTIAMLILATVFILISQLLNANVVKAWKIAPSMHPITTSKKSV
jgi:ABC-type multidrug transport system permease subunit